VCHPFRCRQACDHPSMIQAIRWDRSRSVWIDDPPNMSRPDPSGADQSDLEHLPTDLVVSAGCVRSQVRALPDPCAGPSTRRGGPPSFRFVGVPPGGP
jgi:hypothetical protein